MQLDKIETFVVGNPPPRHGGRYFILLRLTTRCGVTGVGEIYNATFGPDLCAAMARDMFGRHFLGADPHHIEHMWRSAYGAGYSARPDITVMGVLSGLEMACWDIIGKAADKPVYELLGGKVHDRLRSYTYLYPPEGDVYPDETQPNVYNDPDLAAEAALEMVEQGFTAVKFDPAGPYTIYDGRQPRLEDLERSEMFCRRIREAVGMRADLLFGTHGQFTVSGAKRLARRLETYDPLWFEEPVPPENPADMAEVARFTSVPVAAGERLCSKHEFARLLEAGAASILQMNLGRVGGILEAKKIAAMAETRQAQIAPHLYCGPVVAAANIQIATCSPNFLILESIGRFDAPYTDVILGGIVWQDGYVIPPSSPGLGVELDDAAIAAMPYDGQALHLEPQTSPVQV
ncbi:D-galactonate dehydratase [Aliiroseovarius sp. xm-m-379]|uniref:mandelate racemase/muconate lactonizing enzyme family protein n=1 Tax=unclassified Aliiroseovarius TaxID=2623558 RepID=UPI00156A374C|nr:MULTISPECIES: mandelate racemase/muconate lactonizing enzyme family protein [unclassified Aliiroseovarius]NRP25082.1 D-galactonate dehydratase [Aliiroseovarius sp. xm-m-379]NRP31397.1 D-galactonate dehydratase [Aliiroseovarius sp. xm-m-314]NRP33881.1 D-galactonate dehydratase [Aliiroseovarius sp. xm-a-104]NRP45369.1 D-galactonate dehydratase [Aliiroseovarius sp. xm-m-378]NRP50560.1 D-galactonate dehydratase [Aliiroseovarius sp. xm-m-354]